MNRSWGALLLALALFSAGLTVAPGGVAGTASGQFDVPAGTADAVDEVRPPTGEAPPEGQSLVQSHPGSTLRALPWPAVAVGSAVTGVRSMLGGGSTAPPDFGVQQFDRTEFVIDVYPDGDGRWTIRYKKTLANDSQQEAFRSFADRFETEETEIYTDFAAAAKELVSEGANVTGRRMSAVNFTRSARVDRNLGRADTGVVEMSFTWGGFANATDRLVVVGDVFEGGLYVGTNQELVIRPAGNLRFLAVDPEGSLSGPSLAESDSITWQGEISFSDNKPRVVFVKRDTEKTTTATDPVTTTTGGGTTVPGGSPTPGKTTSTPGTTTPPPVSETPTQSGAPPGSGGDGSGGASADSGSSDMLLLAGGAVVLFVAGAAAVALRRGRSGGETPPVAATRSDSETGSVAGADAGPSAPGAGTPAPDATSNGGTQADQGRGETGPATPAGPVDGPDADREPEPTPTEEPLTDEDRVLALLAENDGQMKQSAIVEESGWSKSKVSMVLSEMDDAGDISKLRVGRENLISLAGEEPAAARSPFEDDDDG